MLRINNMCDCDSDNRLRAGGYSVLRRAKKAYKCCRARRQESRFLGE